MAIFTLAVSMYVSGVPLSLPNVIMGLKLMSTIESPTVKLVGATPIYTKYREACGKIEKYLD